MATAFRKKAEAASKYTGVSVEFYKDPVVNGAPRISAFEDDGSLHIRHKNGERACFDVSAFRADDQNAATIRVMKAMDLPVTRLVLVDESDNDADFCPHCGGAL